MSTVATHLLWELGSKVASYVWNMVYVLCVRIAQGRQEPRPTKGTASDVSKVWQVRHMLWAPLKGGAYEQQLLGQLSASAEPQTLQVLFSGICSSSTEISWEAAKEMRGGQYPHCKAATTILKPQRWQTTQCCVTSRGHMASLPQLVQPMAMLLWKQVHSPISCSLSGMFLSGTGWNHLLLFFSVSFLFAKCMWLKLHKSTVCKTLMYRNSKHA